MQAEKLIEMYIKETCIINGVKEVEKYKRMRTYIKGEKRARKIYPTTEHQKRVNMRNAKKKRQRIIRANFSKGDLFVTLTYQKEHKPKTKEAAIKDKKQFIDYLRRKLKAAGTELKYVSITEIGKKGGIHHHFIFKDIDTKLISKLWKKGGIHIGYIYSDDLSRLARYLSGDKEYAEENNKHECVFENWTHSKNLIVPEVIKERIHAKSFLKTPRPEKGYRIEDLRQGTTEWGYEWQSYKLVPEEPPERSKRKKKEEDDI